MTTLVDDLGVDCFVDELGVDCWEDDLGSTLCCVGFTTSTKLLYVAYRGALTGDTYWGNVVFLSNFDGTDESTTSMSDQTGRHTISFVGGGKLDNAQFRYGTTALYAFNTTSGVTLLTSLSDFSFGSAAFCIEFSMYTLDTASIYDVFNRSEVAGQRMMLVRFNAGQIFIYYSTDGTATPLINFGSVGGSANAWHEYCLERDGSNTLRFFRDGTMVGKDATFNHTLFASTDVVYLNRPGAGATAWLDEVRVTKGTFRYGSDAGYTPRTSAFPVGP